MRPDFAEKLEKLIEQNAEDFAVSQLFKEERAAYYETLAERFSPSHPRAFLTQHARATEEFVAAFYRFALRGHFGDYAPSLSALPIAFIALGSFGREQCAPYSDLDLMIVYKEIAGYNLKPLIERVLYLAWDSGFHLGHRAHELNELETAAGGDITIKTAMLEGRFFCGSRLFQIEIDARLNRIRLSDQSEYVAQKLAEYNSRRANNPIAMEPNIKESAGGLRDADALFWIARALYGVSSLKDLAGTLIDEEDNREFQQALESLYRVRVALHLLAKKKSDLLLFQYQREAAILLGYEDTKTRKAERLLLQRVLGALKTISRCSAYYLAKFASGGASGASFKRERLKDLTARAINAPIGADYDISFPMALRRAEGKRLGSSMRRMIRAIFDRPDCYKIVAVFDLASRLETLLPPLKGVINLAQFDGYHARPVDEHSVLTLQNMCLLEGDLKELFDALSADEQALLRLTAVLHDCGKGGARDHSEAGALRFRGFAKALGFRADLTERGMLLIRTHVLMSVVARSRDIYSDRVVFAFASRLGSKSLVTMLYLLTICDMSAVAPNVYTPFAAELLRDLYFRAIDALDKNDQIDEAAARARKEKQLAAFKDFAALAPSLRRRTLAIDSSLFFLKYKPSEIVEFAKRAAATDRVSFTASGSPALTLEAISKAPFNLGWLLGRLSRFDLGAMDIFKLFDGAKMFRMFFRKPYDQSIGELAELVENALDMSRAMKYVRPIIVKKEIEIDCDHSPTYARMSLDAPDQQGLMAFIIDVFDRRGVDVAAAKIATIKRRANNLFLIEKTGRFCADRKEIVVELTKSAT
ncbi:MAG: HD domain-containing protein [Helicobacteraceae bacterium]|nr:HD domain-containing protein [Helicobacteraceae bacterium]